MRRGVVNSIVIELIEIPAGKFTMARPAGDMIVGRPGRVFAWR